jgi:hypothetical protein
LHNGLKFEGSSLFCRKIQMRVPQNPHLQYNKKLNYYRI